MIPYNICMNMVSTAHSYNKENGKSILISYLHRIREAKLKIHFKVGLQKSHIWLGYRRPWITFIPSQKQQEISILKKEIIILFKP